MKKLVCKAEKSYSVGGILPSKERCSCFMAYQFRLGLFKQGVSVLYYIQSTPDNSNPR